MELIAGKESAIVQVAQNTPGMTYVLTFAVGDGNKACEGSMMVEAFAETTKVAYNSNGKGGHRRAVLRFTATWDHVHELLVHHHERRLRVTQWTSHQ